MLSGKSLARTRPTALGSMLQASTYGATIPTIYGCDKSPLLVIWAQNLRTGGSSKKGKKKGISTYVENIDFLIGSNPLQGLLQFWGNNNSRYPLNFVKQRSALGNTVTIADPNFYFVVAVTAEVSLSGTFNDYGGQGAQAWGPTTFEYPLWNQAQHGPDLIDASGARWQPWVFKWTLADGTTVHFETLVAWPNVLPTNGFVNIYYAQLSASNKLQVPASTFRLTFEPQLGNNNAAYSGFSAQQIIYPYYAGASSPNIDLGAMGMIQDTRAEVLGGFSLYGPRGDADFLDMIEDVLKSGMLQVGSQLGQIHRGVNLNELPGPIQKNFFQSLALASPAVLFPQPITAGNRLVAIGRFRPSAPGTGPTISDTQGNTWNAVMATSNKALWYSNPAIGGAGDVATFLSNTGGSQFDAGGFVLEMDSGSTVIDATATNTGPSGIATGSITVTGAPSYILAVAFTDDGIFGAIPVHWDNAFSAQGTPNMMACKRIVAGPGTYTFSVSTGFGTNWWVAMVAFKASQPVSYTKTLGNILDAATALVARAGCRANGLFGSISMNAQKKAADWLTEFYACANTAPVWSGFRLKSIFRSEVSAAGNGVVYTAPTASGPVLNITENMLIGEKGGPLIRVTDKTPGVDDNNILQIEFIDRNSDYNPSVAAWPEQSSVSLYGPRKDSPQVLHGIKDPVIARKLLAIQARRNAYVVPKTYKFKANAKLGLLEAMDLVTINDSLLGITLLPVRLTSTAEDDQHNIDCEAEPFFYGIHAPDSLTVTPSAPYQPNSNADPGSVNTPIIFEPVPRLAGQVTPQVWAVVSGVSPNYGGSLVYLSTDGGASYNPLGRIIGNGVTGVTTANWPIATDPDTTNDLPVDLTESLGTLLSYQVADEDNFVYPCYIAGGNASIPYGLMTYAVATLTAANKYTLKATGGGNKLRRCVFGAPALVTDVAHPNGSRWAFLNPSGQGIFKINMDPLWVGKTLHFKFLAFNTLQGGQQALAAATDYTYTPTGTPGQSTGGTLGSNNQYTITGGALTNPTTTTIAMAQATAQFASGLKLNYNARTFTIAVPGAPTTYYVTIADPDLIGDTGTGTTLTATCQTSPALVGLAGNIYIGSIIALPAAGGVVVSPGGNPSATILVNGS